MDVYLSLLPLRVRWLSRWDAGLRVRAQGTSEQQDVRFGPVDLVVDPSARLLHAKITPLLLGQDTRRVQRLRHLLGQNHVVLILVIIVLLRILDLVGWHWRSAVRVQR